MKLRKILGSWRNTLFRVHLVNINVFVESTEVAVVRENAKPRFLSPRWKNRVGPYPGGIQLRAAFSGRELMVYDDLAHYCSNDVKTGA